MKFKALITMALLGATATLSLAQLQAVISKNEILIGTIQDLSGPLAGYGKQARNGMLLVEDSAARSPRACTPP